MLANENTKTFLKSNAKSNMPQVPDSAILITDRQTDRQKDSQTERKAMKSKLDFDSNLN